MTPEEPTPLSVPADLTTALDRVLSESAEAGVIGARAVRDALAARATVQAGPWEDNPDGTERHYVSPVPAVEPGPGRDWCHCTDVICRCRKAVPAVDEDRDRLAAALYEDESNIGNLGQPFLTLDACRSIATRVLLRAGVSTGAATRTYAWRPDYGPDGEPETSLPERAVVGANGAYWRDYGQHYSMCPVSDDNDPVEVRAVYVRSTGAATPDTLTEALRSGDIFAPPLPEHGCPCSACDYLSRKQAERHAPVETPRPEGEG